VCFKSAVASLIFFLPTVRQQNPQQQKRQVGQHAYAAYASEGGQTAAMQGAWHPGLPMGTAIFWFMNMRQKLVAKRSKHKTHN